MTNTTKVTILQVLTAALATVAIAAAAAWAWVLGVNTLILLIGGIIGGAP